MIRAAIFALVFGLVAVEGWYMWQGRAVAGVEIRQVSYADSLAGVALRLGLEAHDLGAIIALESNHNPKAVNPNTGATGLIQWLPSTAKDMGLTCDSIGRMSALAQLALVERYLAPFAPLQGRADAYWCVFYPRARHKGPHYVVGAESGRARVIGRQNPLFDTNGDGFITKKEVEVKL